MEALPAARPWEIDHQVTPIPWRTELCTTTKRLRIGYIIDDGVVKVQPPVARAIEEVAQALREAGHEGLSFFSYKYILIEADTFQSLNGTLQATLMHTNSGKKLSSQMAAKPVAGCVS